MIPRWLALALITLGACQNTPPRPSRVEHAVLPNNPGPLDALARRFARLREVMRERGAREVRGPARYFALESEGVSVAVNLPVDKCTTFVALGGGAAQDVVATVYDRDGEEVVRDDIANEGALVHVCPTEARHHTQLATFYLALESPAGGGAILVAQFESPRDAQLHFDNLFAGVLVPEVPLREVEVLLARSRSALRARGFSPVAPATYDAVSEGGVVRRSLVMREGRCYAIVARASEGVRDVDVSLFDADGAEVGRDLRGDAEPVLEHCPASPGQYRVDAKAFTGAGAIGLLMLEGPPGAEVVRRAVAQTSPTTVASPGNGARLLRGSIATLVARGYQEPQEIAVQAQTSPGEVRTHDVAFGAGCSVVLGVASSDEMDLDLYLSDAANHRDLDEDSGMQPVARVSACVSDPTTLRIAVKSYGSSASYDLMVLKAPNAIRDITALRLDESSASFRSRGYVTTSESHLSLDEGEHQSRPVVIERAGCVAFAVAGEDGVDDVDMFLRDTEGRLVARESGPASYASVSGCTDGRETLTLEMVMYRGSGAVVLARLEGPR
ncbi:MAG: hypothetical protein IPK60_02590 [Sandaracinaceae bacterium]|nr:hypothetical protein [Sandaracinaceae bacterium]